MLVRVVRVVWRQSAASLTAAAMASVKELMGSSNSRSMKTLIAADGSGPSLSPRSLKAKLEADYRAAQASLNEWAEAKEAEELSKLVARCEAVGNDTGELTL